MRNEDLAGKVAVVTGGSRGIGHFIAKALAEAGATVAITGRNERRLNEAARAGGERWRPYVCDQRDGQAVEAMARAVVDQLGAPDILVNNAGLMRGGNVADLSLDE